MCDRKIEATFPFLSFPFHYSSTTICARTRHPSPSPLFRLQQPSLKSVLPTKPWVTAVERAENDVDFLVFLFSIGGAETGHRK